MKLTFVEMPWFTERIKSRLDNESYRALQNELLVNPEKGKTMSGAADCEKSALLTPAVAKESVAGCGSSTFTLQKRIGLI